MYKPCGFLDVSNDMQPWRHAKLSAKKFGGEWRDYLALHEFIDSAKAACPDLRHRLLLHNTDLGPALAAKAFPSHDDIENVFIDHVMQDLQQAPSLEDWLATSSRPIGVQAAQLDPELLIEQARSKLGLSDPAPIIEVFDLLRMGERFCQNRPEFGLPILMNSFGPILVRRVIGPAFEIEETVFDPSWVSEGIIVAHFGRIPSLDEVLRPFDGLIPRAERAIHV